MTSRFLSVADVAADLGVTEETVRGYIKAKKLIAHRFGRDYKIEREDYERFLRESRTATNDEEKED